MSRKTLQCKLRFLWLACACLLSTTPGYGITLSVTSTLLGGNTANFSDTSPPVAQNLSAVTTLDSGGTAPDVIGGGIGGTVDGSVRYTQVVTADSDALNFASISRDATSNYRVSFTVTPDNLLNVYSVTINTARRGALVIRNEGGASGDADISAVTGTLNGVAIASLGLADPGALINVNDTTVIQISQSNTLVLSGLAGVQNFQLDFVWTSHTSSGNNVITGGDEGVVLLGLAGTVSQVGAADDYPGTSGRGPQSNDGHFVDISATVLVLGPEPSSIVLGSMGGFAIGMALWRRRR